MNCHNCRSFNEFMASAGGQAPDYESSPCSNCRLGRNELRVFNGRAASCLAGLFESESLSVNHPSLEEGDPLPASGAAVSLKGLARCVRRLVALKEQSPLTYGIVDAKMDNPALSYAEIGKLFACTKQNVEYHMKNAAAMMPELGAALMVSSRNVAAEKQPLAAFSQEEALDDSAVKFILENPGMTMREAACRLGMSENALYRHWGIACLRRPGLRLKLKAAKRNFKLKKLGGQLMAA